MKNETEDRRLLGNIFFASGQIPIDPATVETGETYEK